MSDEGRGPVAGPQWVRADVQWQREPDRHCALCGRLLIRTYLASGGDAYCDEDCLALGRDRLSPGSSLR